MLLFLLWVDLGVQGGVPFTHFILDGGAGSRTSFSRVESAPRRYTAGPYLHVPVFGALGVESGLFYKRFGFDTVAGGGSPIGPFTTQTSRTTGNAWEIPVMARLRVRWSGGLHGFLNAGPSFRRLGGIREAGVRTVRSVFPPPERIETTEYATESPPGMDRRTAVGLAFGGGLEFTAGRLRLAPGVRITRWDSERTSSIPAASRIARTQVEALLGIAYVAGESRAAAALPCCLEPGILVGAAIWSRDRLVYDNTFSSVSRPARPLTAGAALDWRFHPRLSVEGSFLARRLGYTDVYQDVYRQTLSGYGWEVPVLLKWRAVRILPSTFLTGGAGPALRRSSHMSWLTVSPGGTTRSDASWLHQTSAGMAFSAGLETSAGAIRLRPEVRYAWFHRPLYDAGSVRTRPDSLAITLGVTLRARRR